MSKIETMPPYCAPFSNRSAPSPAAPWGFPSQWAGAVLMLPHAQRETASARQRRLRRASAGRDRAGQGGERKFAEVHHVPSGTPARAASLGLSHLSLAVSAARGSPMRACECCSLQATQLVLSAWRSRVSVVPKPPRRRKC